MVALDILLVTEDDRKRLVDDIVALDKHGLELVALGALAAMHEVNRLAQGLLGSVCQKAGGVHVAAGAAAALAHRVGEVELLMSAHEVAAHKVEAGVVLGKVSGQAGSDLCAAERILAHIDDSVPCSTDADAFEMLVLFRQRHDLDDMDLGIVLCNDAHEVRRGSCICLLATGDDDDRRLGVMADHDAGIGYLAFVAVDDADDGLFALMVCRHLDIGGVLGSVLDPGDGLFADAALKGIEETGEACIDIACRLGGRDRKRGLIDLEVVPRLRRRNIDMGERGERFLRVCHQPIAPSISSLIRLFISTAYSSGSSLETGFANPFTTMVLASFSEQPRLIR